MSPEEEEFLQSRPSGYDDALEQIRGQLQLPSARTISDGATEGSTFGNCPGGNCTQNPQYDTVNGSDAGIRGTSTSSQGLGGCTSCSQGGGAIRADKALCTSAAMLGYIPFAILAADYREAAKYSDLVQSGYQFWAKPLARVMYDSPTLAKIMSPMCRAWAYNMAYRENSIDTIKFSHRFFGTIFELLGIPACFVIGWVKHVITRI